MEIEKCRMITLPKITDTRGNLTFVENNTHVPFDIKRVYYLYDVPGGANRGGHAHKKLKQLIIAVNGSFDVLIDDGSNKKIITLNRAYEGLIIEGYIWRELINFTSGSVCLVLASELYDASDYCHDYTAFQNDAIHYNKSNSKK